MKKSLITLAVAATAAAPMAASAAMLQSAGDQDGINLYGSLRPQITSESNVNFSDGTSRWGIKGSHDLGNGLSSIYRIERGFSTAKRSEDNATINRLGYAGLSGSFGTVLMGNQWTPYYSTIGSPSDLFASNGLDNYNDTGGPFRSNDSALAYALPGGGMFGGAIAFVSNGDADDGDDIDAISAGVTLTTGPITTGLGYHKVEASEDDARTGLSVAGNFGGFGAIFMVEDVDGANPWAITGTFANFLAQYGDRDSNLDGNLGDIIDNNTDTDSSFFTLGYNWKLSSNTRVQFSYESDDAAADDKWVARYRVDF